MKASDAKQQVYALRDPDAAADQTPVLYLIAETKGTPNIAQLRFAHEGFKIAFAQQHFIHTMRIMYEIMSEAGQLPGFDQVARWYADHQAASARTDYLR